VGDTTFYDRTGEFVAVLLGAAWEGLGPALTKALTGLDAAAGPIVDAGAGTGLGTRVIATTVPEAEIVAVEPDRALRTALLATVAAEPELRRRVTVLGTGLLSAELPEQIGGLVAMNVIGHFTPADRERIWALLAARLDPAGRAVLNLYPPTRPAVVPATPMAGITIGRRHYSGSAAATPAEPDAVVWEMRYRLEQDGVPLTARDHWHVSTPEQLAAELAPHGLRVTPGDSAQGIQVITR
jgi:hypothetical protein